jgi:cell division protein ZapA (FtsZ GTPase activity inhibitor)
MSKPDVVSLNILDKCYQIKCSKEKIAELRESAEYLEKKIFAYQSNQSSLREDKLIITALNLAHELLLQKKQIEFMNQHLSELQNKIAAALASAD